MPTTSVRPDTTHTRSEQFIYNQDDSFALPKSQLFRVSGGDANASGHTSGIFGACHQAQAFKAERPWHRFRLKRNCTTPQQLLQIQRWACQQPRECQLRKHRHPRTVGTRAARECSASRHRRAPTLPFNEDQNQPSVRRSQHPVMAPGLALLCCQLLVRKSSLSKSPKGMPVHLLCV